MLRDKPEKYKPPPFKRPHGRPTKYKPEYDELLYNHLAYGLSYETFGCTIGVCKETVYQWEKKHASFMDAKKAGWQACQLYWEKQGRQGMRAKTFNATIWIYNMKNRFRNTDTWSTVKEETQANVEFKLSYDPKKLGSGDDC